MWCLLIGLGTLAGCTVYTHVPKGQQLVTKVRLKGAPRAHRDALLGIVEQKPNTKIFGVWRLRTRNWYVQQGLRKKKDKPTIWEPPSYYSEEGSLLTSNKMEQYLKNQGYFNASASYKVSFGGLRHKKARVTYKVNGHRPYTIAHVERSVEDIDLYEIVELDKRNSLIKNRKTFTTDQLIDERERLLNLLRNAGYYRFSREYIYFDLDSTIGKHQIDIRIGIKNPEVYERHRPYKIGKMTFREKDAPDSTAVEIAPGLYRSGARNRFVDELLISALAILPGEPYNQDAVQATLRNVRNIQIYEYVDVAFELSENEMDTGLLSLSFILSPYKRRSIQLRGETISSEQSRAGATNTGRLFGLAGSLVYRDVNFANRGIQMETRLRLASEVSLSDKNLAPNNEANITNSFYFAKPFLGRVIPRKILAKISRSSLSISGFYDSNPDFSRTTTTASMGYHLDRGRFKHYVLPIEFNLVSTDLRSESFKELLSKPENLQYKNLFDNHTISGARWGLYYTNRVLGSRKNYIELVANVLEVAGNMFYLASKAAGAAADPDGPFERTFLGMHFFQYAKFDYDIRYHLHTFLDNEVVYRTYVGMVFPFGNTPNSVPFEKRYYTGGANSIRGWPLRQLGPGNYLPKEGETDFVFYHSGNIRLEANVEYRFSLSKLLKMAVFVDAGNVWNSPKTDFLDPKGDWPGWDFYKGVAVAGGLGFRFDFTYFVFRTDLGLALYDPATSNWFAYDKDKNPIRLNIGIGYPF